jgi:hypothetical protein
LHERRCIGWNDEEVRLPRERHSLRREADALAARGSLDADGLEGGSRGDDAVARDEGDDVRAALRCRLLLSEELLRGAD